MWEREGLSAELGMVISWKKARAELPRKRNVRQIFGLNLSTFVFFVFLLCKNSSVV